jgi:hypothetical protein
MDDRIFDVLVIVIVVGGIVVTGWFAWLILIQ